ncbi:MAG TPA: rod shape-determining protein MreC [Nitrospiria bacterium]|nr:rod shape-determining protein MreC [Nitrospiria bacterium]
MRWSWLTRTRGLAILAGVAFLLVLFSPQIQRRPLLIIEQPLLLIESWLQRAIGGIRTAAGDWTDRYVDLWNLGDENHRLRDQVARLEQEVTHLQEQLSASGRRDALTAFGKTLADQAMVADVIGRDPTNWYQSVVINRGQRDGVKVDMGVAVQEGVVGRVIKVMPKTAVVLLVSDRDSVVPGMIQRGRDEGLIQGTGGKQLRMKYVSTLASVQVGDLVITSGLAGMFPKELRIGTVTAIERMPDAISQQLMLAPAVDLNRLEEVLVLPLMDVDAGGSR